MSKNSDDRYKRSKRNEERFFYKYNMKWVFLITIWTFALAIGVSLISESIMRNFEILMALISLILIITIGVVFDIIGIAVAAADEKSFHSMAANRIDEARYAIRLIRNAGPVSNFCNDVIGDISGIISGAAGTIIIIKLATEKGLADSALISVVMTGFIASLTVGGKAFGKEFGIKKSERIIFFAAKFVKFVHNKLKIDILPDLKKKRNKRKRVE